MAMRSRGSGSNDPRLRAREERARREAAALPPEPAAPPASAAEARAARETRAAGSAPSKRGARDAASTRAARSERTSRGERASRSERPAPQRRRWSRGKVAAFALSVVLVGIVVVAVAGFSWLRWFSADDAADIQGTWYLAGTSTPIVITEDRINLTDDVSYRYALDTGDKTIAFTFTNLAGSGCYRFSLDRNELALVDGTFTGSDTLGRDIGWTLEALVKKLQGGSLAPAEAGAEGVTLLSRTPSGASSSSKTPADATSVPDAAGSAGSGDAADSDTAKGKKGKKSETIEEDPVGDLSGKLPADIDEPRDMPADTAGGAAGAGAEADAAATTASGDDGSAAGSAR